MKIETKIFGHRGYPAKFAENSLEGFEYALENGADGIEFDVHLTKDQVPVVMHDEKINRTTDGKGNIKDYTHEELQQFHLENGETITDLKDVFELIEKHDALANLEFKTDKYEYQGIEEIVLNMAKEYEFKHPLIYSSFNLQTMLRCLAIDKNLDCNWLVDKKISDPKKVVVDNGLSGIHPDKYHDFDGVQRIWTIDDEKEAKELMEKNVAGIFTNDFVKMNELRERLRCESEQ